MRKPAILSAKRVALDKTYKSLLIIISLSVFLTIFSMIAIKNLYAQMKYQSKVISKQEKTLAQTKKNIDEEKKLAAAYQEFAGTTENIIGGNPKGSGDRDGENAKIALDALPSKYDFPALTSSLDKLAKSGGFQLTSMTGTDDSVSQEANNTATDPKPIEIPFTLESDINPADGKKFLQLIERSIRPITIKKLDIKGKNGAITVTIDAKTYFQPEKKLNVTEEVVK